RPFQGRFKALHVERGHALAQVAHYVHLNPVRAGIVPAARVLEYGWSSLPRFTSQGRPAWLEAATIPGESGGLEDTARGWRSCAEHLGLLAEEDATRRESRFGRLSRGWMIGTAGFGAELSQELVKQSADLHRFERPGVDGTGLHEARSKIWRKTLVQLAIAFGVNLDPLPQRKSTPEKVRLAAAMKLLTSVSNGWLADPLAMGRASSVSSLVSRFIRTGGTESAAFDVVLSRFAS
ncbi:MAG: hypothetical protein ACREH8_15115, partial [Opitutaceae bacterium]